MNEENLSNLIVIKRSGKRVAFDGMKIAIAIKNGFDSIEGKYNEDDVNKIYNKIISKLSKQEIDKIKIEEIQDMIEEKLMEFGKYNLARKYITYRYTRALVRQSNTTDQSIKELIDDDDLRKQVAVRAFETVKTSFSVEKWKKDWVKVLKGFM